ncbi:MAG: DUF1571 domain-containing protein [Bacteroidia bacterium]
MKIRTFIFFISILAASCVLYSFNWKRTAASGPSCKEIIEKMLKNINDVERLKYNLKITERTNKKFNNFGSSVKLNRKPRKLYLYTNGIEVLWVAGTNKGNALVKPNSFPYFNLNLDPMGSLMRDGQHHTINEMGFDYFGSIVGYITNKYESTFDDVFKLEGEEVMNNRPSYKITITNSDFKFYDYTVGKGENLVTIARKLYVGEYMILENNKPKVDDYKDVKAGQVIKVPSAYAKNVTLYIDKLYYLPIGVRIYDNIGLYEQYDYFFLQVNPKFEDAEFTRQFKGYGF